MLKLIAAASVQPFTTATQAPLTDTKPAKQAPEQSALAAGEVDCIPLPIIVEPVNSALF